VPKEDSLTDTKGEYSGLLRRAITGVILGAIIGAIQVWFFKRDLSHLWAAMVAGVLYMTTWVLFTERLRLAGGKVLLGAAAGLTAAIVWWAIAVHAENAFLQSAVAGTCFGAAYAWSEGRKAP
jgi:hypothetical protein